MSGLSALKMRRVWTGDYLCLTCYEHGEMKRGIRMTTNEEKIRDQQCAECDIRMPQYCDDTGCRCISEYIKYGTGCPILEAEKRAEYKGACRGRLENCLACEHKCEYAGIYIFGETECPLRYHPW